MRSNRFGRRCAVLAGALVLALLPAARGLAWDPSGVWSSAVIRHDAFEQFLLRYVRIGADGVHGVAYGEVGPASRARLERYIEGLRTLSLDAYPKRERLAYWLNLYNALVIRLVLDHYPIASLLEIPGPDGADPFDLTLIEIDGRALSLDGIAEDVLMTSWHDPRIYLGLSCGAIGCPNLQPEPFTGARVDDQLTEAAMAYVNDRRCLLMRDGELLVSSLYLWHQDDFGGSDRAIIHHLMTYADPALAKRLQTFERIGGDIFDWRLNDATNR